MPDTNPAMCKPTRKEFSVHVLNERGIENAQRIARAFHNLLEELELNGVCGSEGREMAIVRTKLEEASFFAKKAMASQPQNQEDPPGRAVLDQMVHDALTADGTFRRIT